ncbi:MAG: response regulator [Tindallia sp. MSAO_Bac2]|nr:MAG: response regulator [Tindallia sp. MSAO_Bac2]
MITRHTLREAQDQNKINVLVAEDQETNRALVVQLLQNRGLRCDVVENGEEAVEACQQKEYDLILMDVQMPVMDGLEATRRIRNLPQKHQPIIAAMTAHAMKEDKERCLESGMDEYLSKPINFDQVNALLQEGIHAEPPLEDEPVPVGSVETPEREAINNLIQHIGFEEEEAKELLNKGIEKWQELITEAERALQQEDVEKVKSHLHALKGASANLYMKKTAQLAAKAEIFAATEETKKLKEALAELRKTLC